MRLPQTGHGLSGVYSYLCLERKSSTLTLIDRASLLRHSYNSCDVGTFPNQTEKDGSGPAAALHSDFSKKKYNYELSWLDGQRLS